MVNLNAPSSLPAIKALILDMDGVLWRGNQPLGDLPAIFRAFEQAGLKVALATNNATLSAAQYLEKLAGFGVQLQPWQIVNSSLAAAEILAQRFPHGGPVFVVGEQGLYEALMGRGFTPLNPLGEPLPPGPQAGPENPLAVIAGMDRSANYLKLSYAVQYIRRGAVFIGTNPDRTYPMPFGLIPGAGAILAALETASDVTPLIAGKPGPEMYRVALGRLGSAPHETLVVGDRLETDIGGAQALGCPTALVLSGVTTPEQAQAWAPPPTLIAPDLTAVAGQVCRGRLAAVSMSGGPEAPGQDGGKL